MAPHSELVIPEPMISQKVIILQRLTISLGLNFQMILFYMKIPVLVKLLKVQYHPIILYLPQQIQHQVHPTPLLHNQHLQNHSVHHQLLLVHQNQIVQNLVHRILMISASIFQTLGHRYPQPIVQVGKIQVMLQDTNFLA